MAAAFSRRRSLGIFLGLGPATRVDRLEVTWPSGRVETWKDLEAGRSHRLEEGRAPVPDQFGRLRWRF